MRNERFGAAMEASNLGFDDLAIKVGAHMKSVQRWYYENRTPRMRRAKAAAAALDVDVAWLWPVYAATVHSGDLVCMYDDVDDVPAKLWRSLARSAAEVIWISAAPGMARLLPLLRSSLAVQVARGVDVRLRIDIDTSEASPPGRVQNRHLSTEPAMLRFDTTMMVVLDALGPTVSRTPVLQLSRTQNGGVFDAYADTFESLWESSPLETEEGDFIGP
ncbi:hypothetical protein AB0M47_26210 [Hamadaea sp. NPDC051192]|uniref:hypothetical protein n=1 Tax=Hamadaea sp. NPDC051192 TaxID=3154940 RepID=UPI0034160CCE